ncbi:MAG: protein-export chaperone SecB [Marinospirillum sp.]|jgi:preprotein translocase subunit SecB|uniref:protein-export chaperone SecB n=1 Tax=Marinospirillum sp. TaxID=2183934 RepID=UPI001A077CE4|nr:protein-export chaperone SecB [Marinospirillum sp.]MBE0505114.1 protein-export chaperone SecB [Marinospirillum sp.]
MSEAPQPQFALQRIYLSDVSFEAPNSPEVFMMNEQPHVDVKLDTSNRKINDELYEVTVKITAQVTFGEKTAFLAEVQQSGAFRVVGIEGDGLEHTLGAFCPNILFPYARESVDGLVVKGGFPPLMIAPVNFEAIFAERKQRQAQQTTQ